MQKILIIAEAGHNHMGYMRHAKLLIEEAKSCGADIVKFQAYNADKIKKPWESRYFELKLSEHTFEEFKEIKEYCDKIDIEFMASAFDLERLQWLREIKVKRFKIDSRSVNDIELLRDIAEKREATQEVIASIPYGDYSKATALQKYLPYSKRLYCIPEYPAPSGGFKFDSSFFPQRYDGISDHTIGLEVAMIALTKGANIIEKHFTLDKGLPGPDQICSITTDELAQLVSFARKLEEITK